MVYGSQGVGFFWFSCLVANVWVRGRPWVRVAAVVELSASGERQFDGGWTARQGNNPRNQPPEPTPGNNPRESPPSGRVKFIEFEPKIGAPSFNELPLCECCECGGGGGGSGGKRREAGREQNEARPGEAVGDSQLKMETAVCINSIIKGNPSLHRCQCLGEERTRGL